MTFIAMEPYDWKALVFLRRCCIIFLYNSWPHFLPTREESRLGKYLTMLVDIHIPAKPLHNRDIVSVHFIHFPWKEICDQLSRHLSLLTYIYLNMDEYWLTYYMPQKTLKDSKCLLVMVICNKIWFLEVR